MIKYRQKINCISTADAVSVLIKKYEGESHERYRLGNSAWIIQKSKYDKGCESAVHYSAISD